mmetsp:Transcript_67841/g.171063  ORF Transcript_67841/g.171063 Transcript_67841/m.171063 type:complete len:87 (-) Transcript_67841:287-547(-)
MNPNEATDSTSRCDELREETLDTEGEGSKPVQRGRLPLLPAPQCPATAPRMCGDGAAAAEGRRLLVKRRRVDRLPLRTGVVIVSTT